MSTLARSRPRRGGSHRAGAPAPATGATTGARAGATAAARTSSSPEEHVRRTRAARLRGAPLPRGWVAWLAPLAVTVAALVLRAAHLGRPDEIIFDETYYAPEARDLLDAGVELDDEAAEPTGAFVVHPPLGKWLIALGIRALGYTPEGWRLAALAAGTLLVWLTCRVGARLSRSVAVGCAAGLLVAVDGLALVQSRVAMLDVFLAVLVLGAVACVLVDRDAVRGRLADRLEAGDDVVAGRRGTGLGPRPWLVGAGLCLGGALATKWTGLYALVAVALLVLATEAGARRAAGHPRPLVTTALRAPLPGVLALGLVPLAVYLASWTGWFLSDLGWDRSWAAGRTGGATWVPDALRSLWHYHAAMYEFHTGLDSPHPYASSPWGWLLLARPVSYAYDGELAGCGADRCVEAVLAVGNPLLFWASVPALAVLTWRWLVRRDPRAPVVGVPAALLLLPWGVFDLRDERTMFLFYVLPALPFLALAVALCLRLLLARGRAAGGLRAWAAAVAVAAYLVGAVVVLVGLPGVPRVGLYPVLTGALVTHADWVTRLWFPSWI